MFCTICLEDIADFSIKKVLRPCKHAFHPACINQWRKGTCPNCRARVGAITDPNLIRLLELLSIDPEDFQNLIDDFQNSIIENTVKVLLIVLPCLFVVEGICLGSIDWAPREMLLMMVAMSSWAMITVPLVHDRVFFVFVLMALQVSRILTVLIVSLVMFSIMRRTPRAMMLKVVFDVLVCLMARHLVLIYVWMNYPTEII